ncbi:MAG: PilZ domain-containing protein [Candidatus Binatia bacterium]
MKHPICPNCSKEFVKRVRPAGLVERLISLFYVYPFKCQLCAHRFRHLQSGVRYIRIDQDRREYERMAVSFPVLISGEHCSAKGTVSDISLGGCNLTTDTELADGDILGLTLQISSEALPVIVEAAVVRNARANNAGFEFLRFVENDRDRLRIFMHALLMGRNRFWMTQDRVSQDHHPSSLAPQRM